MVVLEMGSPCYGETYRIRLAIELRAGSGASTRSHLMDKDCLWAFIPIQRRGDNGVKGRWGSQEFVFGGVDFSSVTYSDYQQAGDPANMATMIVEWSRESGASVSIAFPWNDPEVIWTDKGAEFFDGIDSIDWNFGFAARNGAIDMDVLLGDVNFGYEFISETASNGGGPRNTFDDTYGENMRRSLIVEYESDNEPCPGDTDGNDTVNIDDLLNVIAQFGEDCSGNGGCMADVDNDQDVDIDDLLLVIAAFGPC